MKRALEHLASIELLDLCNEAKVERCRAPRDLSSCGRAVESVLNTCGHASLCPECSQRCDNCPICRIPVSKSGNSLRLRLYYECIEAGLISKRCDDRFQEKEEAEQLLTADVERLYSLFDVAIENNLVSLICHCILLWPFCSCWTHFFSIFIFLQVGYCLIFTFAYKLILFNFLHSNLFREWVFLVW